MITIARTWMKRLPGSRVVVFVKNVVPLKEPVFGSFL